jgi:hypothetical protein
MVMFKLELITDCPATRCATLLQSPLLSCGSLTLFGLSGFCVVVLNKLNGSEEPSLQSC